MSDTEVRRGRKRHLGLTVVKRADFSVSEDESSQKSFQKQDFSPVKMKVDEQFQTIYEEEEGKLGEENGLVKAFHEQDSSLEASLQYHPGEMQMLQKTNSLKMSRPALYCKKTKSTC